MKPKTSWVIALSVVAGTGVSQGALLLSDDFNYPDGPIPSPWVLHSGTNSGSTALNISNNVAIINQSDAHASGADLNRALSTSFNPATDNSTKLYASFTVNFSALPFSSGTATGGSYFAHLKSSALNEFYARIGANTEGAAAGAFRIAVANETWGNGALTVEYPQDLSLNTTYTVVFRFDLATDQTTLWINPSSELSTSVTATDVVSYAAGNIESFALRQGTTGASPNTGAPGGLGLDTLRVGDTFADVVPEPTSLALVGLGGLFCARRRRS